MSHTALQNDYAKRMLRVNLGESRLSTERVLVMGSNQGPMLCQRHEDSHATQDIYACEPW